YVVGSPDWNEQRGAVTWGNGTAGVRGIVSDANSLRGSSPGDQVGNVYLIPGSGNYLVGSPNWNEQRGAVTWADGNTGISGPISEANSLVGTDPGDQVGAFVTPLGNGNYVVASPNWNGGPLNGRGAATWVNGSTGTSGTISVADSLTG